jgi:type VI secretion system protein ImpJ
MYLGQLDGTLVQSKYDFYIEAQGPNATVLHDQVPATMRIASWTQIGYVFNAGIPGVAVAVVDTPPSVLPVAPGVVYMKLDTSGSYWSDIVNSGTIAIYQPVDVADIDLSLFEVPTGP